MSTRLGMKNGITLTQLSAGQGRGLRVEIDYGAGPLRLTPAEAEWLSKKLAFWAKEQEQ